MFRFLVKVILRNRLVNLFVILSLTVFMGFMAFRLQISYQMAQMLPSSDSTSIEYKKFKDIFGEDGSVMFIGIQSKDLFALKEFNDWWDLTYSIKAMEGVSEVVSLARIYTLQKDEEQKKLRFDLVFRDKPRSQKELDSLKNVVFSIPFYNGFLLNQETGATLMMITLDKDQTRTRNLVRLVRDIVDLTDKFGNNHDVQVHYSGLPYIRIKIAEKLQKEQVTFVLAALLVAVTLLLIFFRSFKAAFFTMIIVILNVIWVLGFMGLFGYKLTIVSGIIPPLLIVIVVENCIFLLNKYHHEFILHGNKAKALSRMVERIGSANLLTNAATAAGFLSFVITGNKILTEFGIIASISIMVAYLMCLFLVPIVFSYLPSPSRRHTMHIEKSNVSRIINKVVYIVQHRRTIIYIVASVAIFLGILGAMRLKTSGRIVDDISKKDRISKDMMFMEENFKGVMPFEIAIDTKKKKGAMKLSTIEKINELQSILATYPELSKSLSIADVVKFSRQAFYNGDSSYYGMPNAQELGFMIRYLPKMEQNKRSIINSFIDTNLQVTRISTQMANIQTPDIQRIIDDVRPRIDTIFPKADFNVSITGTSVVFLEGSKYLINHLFMSLLLAIVIIALLMVLLFTSFRMILISIIPNLIPLILTAGMMGYFGITIRPSTVIIFSIALGISVDNAIQYLSRYRLNLRTSKWNIRTSVLAALKETGFSMIYSSVVLFCGFAIFITSSFGGTVAMGYLISFTLFMALFCNLFILPSLLLSLDNYITTKSFRDPMIEIFDEDVDIELEELEIEKKLGETGPATLEESGDDQ